MNIERIMAIAEMSDAEKLSFAEEMRDTRYPDKLLKNKHWKMQTYRGRPCSYVSYLAGNQSSVGKCGATETYEICKFYGIDSHRLEFITPDGRIFSMAQASTADVVANMMFGYIEGIFTPRRRGGSVIYHYAPIG